jgi:hypothetical protein
MLIIHKKPLFDARKQPIIGQCNLDTEGWILEYYDPTTSLKHEVFHGYYYDCREIQLVCAEKEFLELSEYISRFRLHLSKKETKTRDWLPQQLSLDSDVWILTYHDPENQEKEEVFEGFFHDCREIQQACLGAGLDEVRMHVDNFYQTQKKNGLPKSDETVMKKLFKFF